jgi:ankyrin repeat protein
MSKTTEIKKKSLNTMKINLTLSDFRTNNLRNYQMQPLFETICESDLKNGKISNKSLCLGIDSPLSLMEKDIETGMTPLHLLLLSSNVDLDNIKYLLETYRRYAEKELTKDLLKLQNERNNSIIEIKEKFLKSTPKTFKGRSKIQEVTLSMIEQDTQGRKIINSLKVWFEREVERRKRQTEFRIEIFWQKLLSSKDNDGRTPIHYAICLGKLASILEMLLTTGRGKFYDKKSNNSSNQPLFNTTALFEVSTGREVAALESTFNDNTNNASISFAEPKTNDTTIQSRKKNDIDSYGVQVGLRSVLWDLPRNDKNPLFNSLDNQFVNYEVIVPWILRNIIKRSTEMGAKSEKSGLDIVEDLINLIDYNNSKVLILPEVKLLLSLLNIRVTNDVLKELCRMYPTSSDIIKDKWDVVFENQVSLKKQKKNIFKKSFNMNDDDYDAKSDRNNSRENDMFDSDSKQTSYDRFGDDKNNSSAKGGDYDDDRFEDKDIQNRNRTLKLTSSTTIKMKDIKNVIFDMETVGDEDFGLNLSNFIKDLQNGKGFRQITNKSNIKSSINKDSNEINGIAKKLDDDLLVVSKQIIELEEGLKIEGNFKSLGEWMPGILGKSYEDDSFDIIYDNGEYEEQVNRECLRTINIEKIKELDDKNVIDTNSNHSDEDDIDLTDMLDDIISKKGNKSNYNNSPKSNSNNIPGLISLASIKNSRKNVINLCDKDGRTCLYYAASSGRKETVSLILTHGGDISISTHDGKTPFDASTNSSVISILQSSLVNWLTQKELFPSTKRMDNFEKNKKKLDDKLFSGEEDDILLELESPLESSFHDRSNKLIDLQVSMKFLKDNHWSYSRSPLSWAVTNALLPAVKKILKSGADPNIKDTVGKTPLHECLALASPYSKIKF